MIVFPLVILLVLLRTTENFSYDKIKLSEIQTLTFYHGQMTTGRRTQSIPQIQCIAGCHADINLQVVQCYNRGSDDSYNIQWECKTEINDAYQFGRVEIVCEGYDYSNDPYILQGSCGLRYELKLTTKLENNSTDEFLFISIIIIIFFLFLIVFISCSQYRSENYTPTAPPPAPPPPPPYCPSPSPPGFYCPPPGFRPEYYYPKTNDNWFFTIGHGIGNDCNRSDEKENCKQNLKTTTGFGSTFRR